MTNNASKQIARTADHDDFDPTKPEGALVESRGGTDGSMTLYLASNNEIRNAISAIFEELPEQVRNLIFEESVQINHSTRRIVFEHMRIGAAVHAVLRTVISELHKDYPPTPRSVAFAEKKCYEFFAQTQKYSKATCQLYLRQYERFCDNPDAMAHLSVTDMKMLMASNRADEVVSAVIEHRKLHPDATVKEIKQVVDDYEARLKRAHATIESQKAEIDVLCERTEVAEQMERDARDDREKVERQLSTLHTEMEGLKKTKDTLTLAVKRSHEKYDALLREQQEAVERHNTLSAQYREALANPETVEKYIEKVPEGYNTLKEALDDAANQLGALSKSVAAEKDELNRTRDQLARTTEDLKTAGLARQQFQRMLLKFTEFSAEFSASKLVSNITGPFAGQRDVLQALSDQMTEYVAELRTALESIR